jgi:hypothetical protein
MEWAYHCTIPMIMTIVKIYLMVKLCKFLYSNCYTRKFHTHTGYQYCGTEAGTATTATICVSGSGSNIKWNTKVKK